MGFINCRYSKILIDDNKSNIEIDYDNNCNKEIQPKLSENKNGEINNNIRNIINVNYINLNNDNIAQSNIKKNIEDKIRKMENNVNKQSNNQIRDNINKINKSSDSSITNFNSLKLNNKINENITEEVESSHHHHRHHNKSKRESQSKYNDKNPKKINKKNLKGKNIVTIGLLGPSEVGKSSFAIKFTENKYEQYYVPSIDIETKNKNMLINKHNYIIKFKVGIGEGYDLSKFDKELIGCDFYLLFYDVNDELSFDKINNNIQKLQKYFGYYSISGEKILNYSLVGNKNDSEIECKFNDKIKILIDKYKIKNNEISVKTGKNMNNLITSLVEIFDKCAYPTKQKKND